MRIQRKTESSAELNLTPIIDMVFLLLIFFLTATKFADIERDIRVKPPASANARPITAIPQEVVVNVREDGTFVVAARVKSLVEIEQMLAAAVQQNPNQAVVVRGDGRVALEHAVRVLDICEKYGIKRTFLTTRRDGEE